MADSKIEDLSELTSVASADVLPIVDDASGTPVTKKITKANLVTDIAHTDLTATGTKNSTTFLRGDNTWATNDTNATHTGEVTGSGALTVTDNIIDEANLKVDNTPTNDYVLTAKSGAAGGLTWKEGGGGAEATPVLQAVSYSAANASPATEGTHKVSIFAKTIDSNNQGLYVRLKKNGAYVDVQIA